MMRGMRSLPMSANKRLQPTVKKLRFRRRLKLYVGRYESGNHRKWGKREDLARQAIGLPIFIKTGTP
ncbi:6-phosphofructo-2-kinase [Alicycliphilus sp. B1]|nr:6-phosphofructo-2-kinase [Alicycliphilus sp. B1]